MGRHIQLGLIVAAAFSGGVAFVLSCGQGPSKSSAQLNCTSYQVMRMDMDSPYSANLVPAGWTPIGSGTFSDTVLLAKCGN
jgi:hypothetical protein